MFQLAFINLQMTWKKIHPVAHQLVAYLACLLKKPCGFGRPKQRMFRAESGSSLSEFRARSMARVRVPRPSVAPSDVPRDD